MALFLGLVDCPCVQQGVDEVGVFLSWAGGSQGGELGEDWAGICYVKATDIHRDIPHFTAFLFLKRSNITQPHCTSVQVHTLHCECHVD